MKCPVCPDTQLTMADRQGIEIDYCGQCRGIWLDRGELDKIIEKSAQDTAPSRPGDRAYTPDTRDSRDGHYRPNDGYSGYGNPKHRKRKTLLGELFDF